ncbi:hypothetical protein K431DRAFT_287845 [Polychaeton citri CBS 116435]|uniref:Velvet domain-containing protein n=1 Tax=Polychaeton citri CBS 116435 TaxID=1314669 RepID=A0A9P4Q2B1_9PEZI|nr:hypothetical protein K431DRAFT_287845 [Polychaeton citri CBS 116435]
MSPDTADIPLQLPCPKHYEIRAQQTPMPDQHPTGSTMPSRTLTQRPALPPIQTISDQGARIREPQQHAFLPKLPRLPAMQGCSPGPTQTPSRKVTVSQLLSNEPPPADVSPLAVNVKEGAYFPSEDCSPFPPQTPMFTFDRSALGGQAGAHRNAPSVSCTLPSRGTEFLRKLSPPVPTQPPYEPSMPIHPSRTGYSSFSPQSSGLLYSPTLQRTTNHPDRLQQSPALSTYSSTRSVQSSQVAPSPVGLGSMMRFSKPPPFNYHLTVRQQPAAARACGFGERDRRVIDPPPILELKITNRETGTPELDVNAMLALNCTLLTPEGQDDTEIEPQHPDMQSMRRLMGTLVASPYTAKDENGVAGTFFVFPDLSCRSPGKFRLHFTMMRIDPTNMSLGAVHSSVATATSDVFCVYTAKDFPGMRPSSALLKSLRHQGLSVGIKKGSEARKGKGRNRRSTGSDDEDEDDDDDGESLAGSEAGDQTVSPSLLRGDSLSPETRKAQSLRPSRPKRKRVHV